MSDQPGHAEPEQEPRREPAADGPDVVRDESDEVDAQAAAHAALARQRRLDAAFGSGEHHGGGKGDAWYRDQTPPHHG